MANESCVGCVAHFSLSVHVYCMNDLVSFDVICESVFSHLLPVSQR